MSKPEMKNSSQGSLKTLLKGLRALEEVCRRKNGLKQSELAAILKADRSTALRILNTMIEAGYLYKDADGRYHPTMRIPWLSHLVLEGMEIRGYARKHLEKVTLETGFSSHLAILSEGQVVYVDGEEGRGMIKVNAGIGNVAPVHCSATGKALAAYLEESSLKTALRSLSEDSFPQRYTANTIKEIPELLEEFSLTRQRGYAVDNEEYEVGIKCVAVPIFDYTGAAVATIGLSGTVSKIEEIGIESLAEMLQAAAATVSSNLGYANSEKRGEENA
jgi:IclR family transcriptional regulator, KDG regulon repressor